MRYLHQSDFVGALETGSILKGKIYGVNAQEMTVDVEVDGFDGIIQKIPLKPIYCSSVCKSAVVVVPRKGDIVWLGRSQGEWIIIGYVAERLIDTTGTDIGKNMLGSHKVEDSGKDTGNGKKQEKEVPIYDKLAEGDVGFFVHEGDRVLDFMMLRGGRIVMGFGAGTVIYDQDEVMERKLLNKYRSIDANGGAVEWGFPEVVDINGLKVTKFKEFMFKLKTGDGRDVFQFGYIDDGISGQPEKSKFGGNLRYKLKIGKYEINVDDGGNGYITVNNVKIEMENEDVVIRSMKKETVDKDVEINIRGSREENIGGSDVKNVDNVFEVRGKACRITAEGDMIIEGRDIRIEGVDIKIIGQVSINDGLELVLSSLLPLLMTHTHVFYGDGKVGKPIGLERAMDHITKTIIAS